MVKFAGTYKRTKEEGYEDFLNQLGLNYLLRKAATVSTPVMEITETSPGKWRIKTMTTLKNIEVNFKLGEPFEEKFIDGRDVTTTITQEGDSRWISMQKDKKPGGTDVTVVRDFSDEGISVEMTCKGVVSKQYYTRQ